MSLGPSIILKLIMESCICLIKGTHGFMRTHKWRDTIGAFINVEASGTGGPGRMFSVANIIECIMLKIFTFFVPAFLE